MASPIYTGGGSRLGLGATAWPGALVLSPDSPRLRLESSTTTRWVRVVGRPHVMIGEWCGLPRYVRRFAFTPSVLTRLGFSQRSRFDSFESRRVPLVAPSLPPRLPSISSTSPSLWRSRSPGSLPGPLSRCDVFASSTRSLLTFLGRFWDVWQSPGTPVSPPGSSGSSPSLPRESSLSLGSERLLTRSNVLRSFFGRFPSSSTPSDALDASVTSLVGPSSQLARLLIFPSSSTPGGSSCCFAVLSGGSDGCGECWGGSGTSSTFVEVC